MDSASMQGWMDKAMEVGVDVGGKIVGAILLWIVGKWLIGMATGMIAKNMERAKTDGTLIRYMRSVVGILLNIVLIIAVLGIFGVETTTFAGLLAAAGVAVGMAWSGLLSNLAAGVFMIVLRPFKAGDYVIAGGVEGTVVEIGLFVTAINTPDNCRTYIGNSAVFGGTIKNYSANPYRRVELTAQLNHGVDHRAAIEALRAKVPTLDNVLSDPGVDFEILTFNLAGPVLAVRPYCHTAHYWQVYFDTNQAIRDAFGEAGFPVPQQHLHIAHPAA